MLRCHTRLPSYEYQSGANEQLSQSCCDRELSDFASWLVKLGSAESCVLSPSWSDLNGIVLKHFCF